MDLFFYIVLIVAFSLLYYGYVKKKDTDLKIKQIALEEKKIELEIKQIEAKQGNYKQDNSL